MESIDHKTPNGAPPRYTEPPPFPQSLLCWDHYDAARLFAVFLLALSLIYFAYWCIASPGWLASAMKKIPLIGEAFKLAGFCWHLLLVVCCYCLAWLTFEQRSLSGYASAAFATIFGMIYILSPVDFIPDMLPGDSLDDATIGGSSIILGVRGWMQAAQRRKTGRLVLAALSRGDQDGALKLLLEEQGIETKA